MNEWDMYEESKFKYVGTTETTLLINNFWNSRQAIKRREVNSILEHEVFLFPKNICATILEVGDIGYLTLIKKQDTITPPSIAGFLLITPTAEHISTKPPSLHPAHAYARQPFEDYYEKKLGQLIFGEEFIRTT